MRTAYEKGYDVVTLTDCTAATSDEEQRVAVARDYPMFSRPMTGSEFTASLAGSTAAAG
jgi:nicotinamidase-related amidase